MKILARCYDMILVQIGDREIAESTLHGVEHAGDRTVDEPIKIIRSQVVSFDPASLEIFECDSGYCGNYGPREVPPGAESLFQQLTLYKSSPPWKGGREGHYCMGCSLPPR